MDYVSPSYIEEKNVDATTPGVLAIIAIIVVVAEVIANVGNPSPNQR